MSIITRIKNMLNDKLIPGYRFIERKTPEHEPNLVGTRLTVTWAVGLTNYGKEESAIETVIAESGGLINRDMMNEAFRYYSEHKQEVDTYMAESRAKSGTIIKDGKVIKRPDV